MLSIITSWRNRQELKQAWPRLAEAAALAGGDLTVVDYSGDRLQLAEQLQDYDPSVARVARAAQVAPAARARVVRVARVEGEPYFNKARAQNIGAYYGQHEILFFCDCDILINPHEIAELATEVANSNGTFATLAGVTESTVNARQAGNVVRFGYELRIQIANGRELHIVDFEENAADGTRQAPGLLLVKRTDFLAINGYNGRLHGWGWEDQDMISRLTLAAGLKRIQRGKAIHLSHDDAARMAHYPAARNRWESRDRMFRQALSLYDEGDFSGTFSQDHAALDHRLG